MPKGYRAFKIYASLDEVFLAPANGLAIHKVPLEYPLVRAICGRGHSHRAPAENCNCGYHAYYNMGGAGDYCQKGAGWVMAEVYGYGTVQIHTGGWRAESVEVMAFYTPVCDVMGCEKMATVWQRRGRYDNENNGAYVPPSAEYITQISVRCNDHVPVQAPQLSMMPAPGDGLRAIGELAEMLRDKFDANVYDDLATNEVFGHYDEWRESLRKGYENLSAARRNDKIGKQRLTAYQQMLRNRGYRPAI